MSVKGKDLNVYIFRHGETDYNRQRRYQGNLNIPLNATGLLQAQNLAENLREVSLNRIITSDLDRAWKTAEAVNEFHSLILESDHRFRESFMGEGEGKFLDELEKQFGVEFIQRWRSPFPDDYPIQMPKGESKREVLVRALMALEYHIEKSLSEGHDNIAISTHGGVLRLLIHHLFPALDKPIPIPNCSCYLLKFKNGNWSFIGQQFITS